MAKKIIPKEITELITPEKLSNALYALQGVLIRARSLAHEPNKGKQVAELLDYAEHLPRLIASHLDETNKFRAVLAEVAARYECTFILRRFGDPAPAVW